MAYISEVNFLGGGGAPGGEYVEVVLSPGDDPADFVVSVYASDGTLHTNAGIPGGEVNLSSLTGTADPENPDYTIYTIPVGIRNGASDVDEGVATSLTNVTSDEVLNFYSTDAVGAITATEGAAAGAESVPTFDDAALSDGESYQWDVSGDVIIAPISPGDAVVCLTDDCLVKTIRGPVRTGDLAEGDLVWTLDHGYQPIRWIGKRTLSKGDLAQNPNLRPVRIKAGALAPDIPSRETILSPQHRVLVRSPVAMRMFEAREVLVASIKLCDFDGIDNLEASEPVTYVHLLFDQHEILSVHGAMVESLLLGAWSERVLDDGIFKDASGEPIPAKFMQLSRIPARPLADKKQGKKLIARMLKNRHPIQPKDDSGQVMVLKTAS